MKEILTSEQFSIENVLPFSSLVNIQEGIFLLLLRADAAPPHLIMVNYGCCFDLGFKGPNIRNDIEVVLTLIKNKSTKAVFISLLRPHHYSTEILHTKMKEIVMQYEGLDTDKNDISCLSPIKDFCNWAYDIDVSQVNFIFDLLPLLYKKQIAGYAYHLNMDGLVYNRHIKLTKYTRFDIDKRIAALKANH